MCARLLILSRVGGRGGANYRDAVTGSAPINAFATSIPSPETQKQTRRIRRRRGRGNTACPVHCARKKKPSDSAEEDEDEGSRSGGGGRGRGRASMLVRQGRAGGDPSVGETEKRS